jgi:chorismate synthase
MIEAVDEARRAGDTLGGVFEVVATGVPLGLGSHVHWDRRLDGALAAAICSIQAVKGVEFGHAFAQARQRGSAVHDVIEGVGDEPAMGEGEPVRRWLHRTNRAGGLTGGITNGEPIVVRAAVKPISTLARPLPSADLLTGRPVETAHYERSDIAVVPAAGVIGEAMVLLTLTRFLLEKTGGDSLGEVVENLARYRARTLAVAAEVAAREGEAGISGERDDREVATGGDG